MSNFAACLSEIRDHYKKNILEGKRARYIPSQEFAHFFANDNRFSLDAAGQDILSGLELEGQSLGREESALNETGITSETQKLKDADVSEEAKKKFREELEKKREEAKKRALENVDKIYDTALTLAEEHPEYQNEILIVVEKIDIFFSDLFGKIANYIKEIVDAIVEWVENAWNSIKDTFNSIGNWISSWF
jgi:hypothetical protein